MQAFDEQCMHTRDTDYHCGEVNLRGYLAHDEAAGKRPGVLVFHEGLGLGDFAMERARRLAARGYVALAADMFGERRQAADLQQAMTLIGGLRTNPAELRARARAALATLTALPEVDAARCAAIGYCFGGTVALELARDGAELKAVASFHGVLSTTQPAASGAVKASVLVLTGADDPLAPPDQVAAFEDEMRGGKVTDWQVISYGNALHGFANPSADGSIMESAHYNAQADRRSWAAMHGLFDEVLALGDIARVNES